ncbi:glutamate racemase [Entomospira culicis]|uniref:Glutamate racemase n=1 Tax=Entomospira culicis TaxID=2719989 RepID=A0A968GGA8_9SPIO|nr:aspartate/glutamate racemase family protein [Entomospira culicis]NIZ19817.1 hypothetical protein [Entomospira culicis]NIZ70031.1 hypothetical protein [Entomospira culicis]WDI37137.1 aspartate/glutamate racemase family protein [Entomospira culicis]WDI38766.1 aspartate/glutamate racemase family protein [Entomospira culicis]
MTKNHNILIIDSGIGGLPYFTSIKHLLEAHALACTIDYLADNDAFPYGAKNDSQLQAHLHTLANKLKEAHKHYDVIVIACNTASIYGKEIFTKHLPNTPILTTTPTLCMQNTSSESFLLLATSATCRAYQHLGNITIIPADPLVRWVETLFPQASQAERMKYLETFVIEQIPIQHPATLILGCTHFLHIKNDLEKLLTSHHLQIAETTQALAQELLQTLLHQGATKGKVQLGELYLTRYLPEDKAYYQKIAGEYHFEFNKHRLF